MHELPRDLVTILLTEARNQRTPPVDYVVAEDGGRMVRRPEPNIAMAELLEEAAAALAAERAPAARSGGLKPLDEDDYEDIVNAATIRMRKAMSGARGQMITVQDGLDWWIMKETERRILAAIEAANPAPAAKPVAWLHEMKEPGNKSSILSRSPENPFGHWLEKYREQCTYSITPLYASPSEARARIAALEAQLAEMRKALAELDRMNRGVDWCDNDEQARRWSAARRALEGGRK